MRNNDSQIQELKIGSVTLPNRYILAPMAGVSDLAYRMICKDTIEDKILSLQEKKKALARDLISDESGFVKSLTKEDVEYLFS